MLSFFYLTNLNIRLIWCQQNTKSKNIVFIKEVNNIYGESGHIDRLGGKRN